MKDFAAIDFETANECPGSVCSVGVVVVRGGRIAESFYCMGEDRAAGGGTTAGGGKLPLFGDFHFRESFPDCFESKVFNHLNTVNVCVKIK